MRAASAVAASRAGNGTGRGGLRMSARIATFCAHYGRYPPCTSQASSGPTRYPRLIDRVPLGGALHEQERDDEKEPGS